MCNVFCYTSHGKSNASSGISQIIAKTAEKHPPMIGGLIRITVLIVGFIIEPACAALGARGRKGIEMFPVCSGSPASSSVFS
jgi:hypothetical protein